jgi:hypothetical protein
MGVIVSALGSFFLSTARLRALACWVLIDSALRCSAQTGGSESRTSVWAAVVLEHTQTSWQFSCSRWSGRGSARLLKTFQHPVRYSTTDYVALKK